MNRVLVTGATGFVGSALCAKLTESGFRVRAAVRADPKCSGHIAETAVIGDVTGDNDLTTAFAGTDAVVHTAARTHVLSPAPGEADLCMAVNAFGTRRLAEAAARAGVRRFVYVSSIKVNGDERQSCYTPADEPHPSDAYGASKLAGERHLWEVAARTGMEAVVIRPPLVYGPGVRANFLRLLAWVSGGWPLPLGSVENRRSLVNIWNLCDLLLHVLRSPTAAGRTWLVSDGFDLSTPQLIRTIGGAMGRRVKMPSVPVSLLYGLGTLLGRRAEVARLCGSLTVDIRQTCDELDWSPPLSVAAAISQTVEWYLREARSRGD